MLLNSSRSRDILECIASLSSDEVATPPSIANQVLDMLPSDVWTNKDLKWLDPACKTGVFLREAARRLMVGLKDAIPDEAERREHIFKKMLHGYALTELTAQMSRRSLYYTKDPSDKDRSVVQFKEYSGNIQFSGQDHPYSGTNAKCSTCGALRRDFGGDYNKEHHAYDFIHLEKEPMKIDVVVGNPPYQLRDGGGGTSAMPIYHHFVRQAFQLRPSYVAMIIPSRWFAGGKGLDSFRQEMLSSKNFRYLFDFSDASLLFSGPKIEGGVCYFLWDRAHSGPCEVTVAMPNGTTSTQTRFLGEHGDVFVRFNEALSIIEKIKNRAKVYLDEQVSSRKPFGFDNAVRGASEQGAKQPIAVYSHEGTFYVSKGSITTNREWVDKWKVYTSKAGQNVINYPSQVIGRVFVGGPNTACTESYLVAGVFESQGEAEEFAKYLRTRLVRFLVAMRISSHNLTQSSFGFVPAYSSGENTDSAIYSKYGLTQAEVQFVESIARPWVD